MDSGKEVDIIIKDEGLEQVTDDEEIESMIDEVIANNPNNLNNIDQVKIGFLDSL